MASTATAAEDRKGKRPMNPEEDEAEAATAAPPAAAAQEGEVKEQGEEGEKLLLVTDDGEEVRISVAAGRVSAMLRGMIEDDCATGRIPVQGVHADVLKLIVEYCEKHAPHFDPEASARDRYPFPPFPVELPPSASSIKPVTFVDPDADPHGLKAFDKKFLDVDNSTLFEIIMAANYLNIEDLLDDACTAVADKMRGKSPEEIREIFEIENDYTPEQEAEVRRENAWAFED
uniref:SKP1-like protein n=1 Tax=Leersia perrieri TaxID=77586 RepID=A0A0D9XK06_9ORYZ